MRPYMKTFSNDFLNGSDNTKRILLELCIRFGCLIAIVGKHTEDAGKHIIGSAWDRL